MNLLISRLIDSAKCRSQKWKGTEMLKLRQAKLSLKDFHFIIELLLKPNFDWNKIKSDWNDKDFKTIWQSFKPLLALFSPPHWIIFHPLHNFYFFFCSELPARISHEPKSSFSMELDWDKARNKKTENNETYRVDLIIFLSTESYSVRIKLAFSFHLALLSQLKSGVRCVVKQATLYTVHHIM